MGPSNNEFSAWRAINPIYGVVRAHPNERYDGSATAGGARRERAQVQPECPGLVVAEAGKSGPRHVLWVDAATVAPHARAQRLHEVRLLVGGEAALVGGEIGSRGPGR